MRSKIIRAAGGAAGLAALLITAAPAMAGTDVNARIDALEHELRELKAAVAQRDTRLSELEANTADLKDLPKFDPKRLQISSRDGQWSIRFGGRIHLDGTLVDDDATQIGSGAEIRRAWWDVTGKVAGDWNYKLQVGFEGNQAAIKDAYVSRKFGDVAVTLGNHKEAYSLEELIGSNDLTFIERGLPNVFAPSRNLGVSASYGGSNWGVTAGAFTDGIRNGGTNNPNTDWAVTGRVHVAPIASESQVVHLGVAGSYRGIEDETVRYNARPEFNRGRGILDTGNVSNVDKVQQVGPELAAVWGPVSIQGEYHWATLERNGGLSDADLEGGYAYASWFVTGESRAYNAQKGTFARPKAHGAVELAARYSVVDLKEASLAATNGKETNVTLGANYYVNPNVRLMLNYVNADIKRDTAANEKVDAVVSRLQIDF